MLNACSCTLIFQTIWNCQYRYLLVFRPTSFNIWPGLALYSNKRKSFQEERLWTTVVKIDLFYRSRQALLVYKLLSVSTLRKLRLSVTLLRVVKYANFVQVISCRLLPLNHFFGEKETTMQYAKCPCPLLAFLLSAWRYLRDYSIIQALAESWNCLNLFSFSHVAHSCFSGQANSLCCPLIDTFLLETSANSPHFELIVSFVMASR